MPKRLNYRTEWQRRREESGGRVLSDLPERRGEDENENELVES